MFDLPLGLLNVVISSVSNPGEYQISVKIFGRSIANSPLNFHISSTHEYSWQMPVTFKYPTKCWWDEPTKRMFVLDSGNKRVRVLKENGDVVADVKNDEFKVGFGEAHFLKFRI